MESPVIENLEDHISALIACGIVHEDDITGMSQAERFKLASSKTLAIAATENRAVRAAYRQAFKEVQQRRKK